ncbi:AraC family ligand binding domain-containing protein, partial [Rivihabitans pingtungensis]|uniref:AraC family ligand binding domain-containing protein n=1 Tax=Rivihabitans pingtungensis TaxID=1054498 RepID=UPI002C1409F2
MVMIEADPHLSLQRSVALPWVDMRRANRSSACYQTHSHDEFSFGVIDNGHARYLNHGRQHHIGPGMTVWIDPGVAHACNPALGAWSYRMLFVEAGWMGRLQEELPGLPHQDYTPFAAP